MNLSDTWCHFLDEEFGPSQSSTYIKTHKMWIRINALFWVRTGDPSVRVVLKCPVPHLERLGYRLDDRG
jgi:hypothetical protein